MTVSFNSCMSNEKQIAYFILSQQVLWSGVKSTGSRHEDRRGEKSETRQGSDSESDVENPQWFQESATKKKIILKKEE